MPGPAGDAAVTRLGPGAVLVELEVEGTEQADQMVLNIDRYKGER